MTNIFVYIYEYFRQLWQIAQSVKTAKIRKLKTIHYDRKKPDIAVHQVRNLELSPYILDTDNITVQKKYQYIIAYNTL